VLHPLGVNEARQKERRESQRDTEKIRDRQTETETQRVA